MLSSTSTSDAKDCADLVRKVIERPLPLSMQEAERLFAHFLCTPDTACQLSAVLAVMRHRGESADEIMGLYKVIRRRMLRLSVDVNQAIDIGGTGGGHPTLNISTTAALIVAAAGIRVCKHGNYRVSSVSGSFDLLTSLGLNVELCASPSFAQTLYEKYGITFLSTRSYHDHPAALVELRKRLGFPTAFNVVGPLLNPANVPYQIVGIANPADMQAAAGVLRAEGRLGFALVHGQEGIDEVSPCGPTTVLAYRDGILQSGVLTPADFGLAPAEPLLLQGGGSAKQNAALVTEMLNGQLPDRLQVVLPTAALALYTCKAVNSLGDGVLLAKETVGSGKAAKLLCDLREALRCEQELNSAASPQ